MGNALARPVTTRGGTNANGSLKFCFPVCQANEYPELTGNGKATGQCLSCPKYSTSTGTERSCSCAAASSRFKLSDILLIGYCNTALQSNLEVSTTAAGQTSECGCSGNAEKTDGECTCKVGYYNGGHNADGTLKRCYPVCDANKHPQLTADGVATGECVSCPKYSTSSRSEPECTCRDVIGSQRQAYVVLTSYCLDPE